jgi:uncharacterized glyoxalase superfamily protein PhnB
MARLKRVAPTFLVEDVAATAEWYREHLGFDASFFPKMPPHVYGAVHRDGVEIMLLRLEGYRKAQIARAGGNWDAYIRIEGVREFYESIRQKTPIRMELKKQSYGDTEFEVADPNGYVLVFGEIID